MKGYVYILCSKRSGHYYIGSTSNVARRFRQHKQGQTKTTKRFGECKLVFQQEFTSIVLARRIERKLKSWKRKDFIERIIHDGEIKVH